MSTFREQYEEWEKSQSSSSFETQYRQWEIQNGYLDIESIGKEINNRVNTWLQNNNNFVNNYNHRIEPYQDTDSLDWAYRSDSSDWLSTITTQNGNFSKEAENIKSLLEQYKDYFNEDYYNSVTQALDGNLKMQGDILSASTQEHKYWSQWDTEDAYNEYLARMNYDLEAGKAEIDALEAELSKYDMPMLGEFVHEFYDQVVKPAFPESEAPFGGAGYKADELEAILNEKKQYYTLAERAQKAVELASVADPDSKNYDPEFEKYSGYVSTTAKSKFKEDITYEYINGDDKKRSQLESKYREYLLENVIEKGYGHLTDKEKSIYNYYYAKGGEKAAEEYLATIQETLNYKQAKVVFANVKDNLALEYTFAAISGLDQFSSGIENMLSNEDYIPTTSTEYASGMIREDLANDGIPLWYNVKEGEWEDKILGSSLGQVGYDVINTTSNMLPSVLVSTGVGMINPVAGQVVGAGLLGMSAGGHGRAEMLRLGYSKEQANTYGAMVALAEGGMEYLLGGITKLGGVLPNGIVGAILNHVDNALARVAIQIGGSMLSEGFEEGLQTVIEPWLKEIATGVDWDDPKLDEVLYSSLLGAISALGLEGAGVTANEVNTYIQGKKVQGVYAGVEKLQKVGQTFSADTVAYRIANKVNAQTDAYTIGRLLTEVDGTISEQNVADIVNGLEAKGIDSKTATTLARQYQAILNAEMNISDEQVKILENLSPLADVLRTNIIGSNTTVYQRTRGYVDLMSLADEVSNGKKSKASSATGTSSATPKSTTNIFEQGEINSELQKLASDVATGSRMSASERAMKNMVDSASSAAAQKLGVEGRYTSSETGSTRLKSNRGKVSIVGVASIGEDGLMLKLSDGSVVSADDIDFSTTDEALVYEAVANMGVSANTAWEIIKGYNPKSGQSGTIYAMGANEAYTYGHNGVKSDGMSKDGFSALLSETQKNTANRLGDIDARAKVEAQQKTIDKAVKSVRDEAKSKHKAMPKRKGETIFEGDRSKLADLQEKQLGVLEKVAEGLGVTFHIFESQKDAEGKRYYVMPNGKITSANGWYDPKTGEIWIDLYAGDGGQGTMIFTAAHELTHFIRQWSPAKFKVFADFLFEQYGKKGQDVNQLIQNQINKAANNGRAISWDEAYEEVVADSCETFLRDSKAAEKIAALREKDTGLANKIKSFLGQMLAKMRKVMADLDLLPDTDEGEMVAKMTDSLEKLYDLWTDALADAGKAYSTVGGELDLDGNENSHILSDRTMVEGAGLQFVPDADGVHYQVLDANGNPVDSVTPEMIVNSPLGQLVTSAKDNGFLGTGKEADIAAKKQYKFLAELVNMCINYDGLAPIWETAGTMVFSSIKSNADKQYGLTIDFSTVCKKTQAIVDAMSEAMVRLGRGLTRSEVETIYLEVGKAGESTPCPVCYVFSRWMGIGGILDQMSRFQDKYTNMSERELQAFIADIKKRISERANTPNKKGELKKDFFDKNGAIKEGQVIADLKQKANSGAGSTLNAITKNSDTQLQIQELKALMENQDAKEAKKTASKIKKLEAKLVDVSALEKQFKEYNDAVEEYEAYQWLTRTLMEEVDGNWVKNKQFKPVPKDVLFDLNKGATFAEDYPLSWAFRTGKGASAGKAITPYADARVGEAIQGIASQDVKNIKTGIDLNPFLNGDEKTRQKIIASAIEKQARQNLIGGQRYQSTSDFRYEYGSDYLITFLEMQAIGAKVQLYTKVIEAVDFLASMGADINLSVMPLSDGYVTLPNGKKKLIYSSVTGIDAEAAIKKAHEYNNVQLILVGISDEHIRLALEGDDVTFVIPFHGSGNSVHQIQALMNLLGENLDVTTAEDYTSVQSDHVSPKQTKEQKAMWDLRVKILTGKASTLSASEFSLLDKNAYLKDLYNRFYVNENADEFGINLSKDVAEQIFPYEYWDKSLTYAEADKNGERFKEYCASMGIIPRFSGMNSKGENVGFGDFTNNKGYWKLLIDRPMYDNTYDSNGNWTGYGKYHEQKQINCSNFQVKHLDPEYGSATYGEVMSKANDPKKTNMIVDRAIAQFEKLSDRAGVSINGYDTNTTNATEAADLITHIKDIVKTRGSWRVTDVFEYVDKHPTLRYIDMIYSKDKNAKFYLEEFLNGINDIKLLENLSWYMGEAYIGKDETWSWSEGTVRPYRGAVRTFRNAVKKRINAIMTEKVGGTNLGVKNGDVSLADIRDMYHRLNSNEDIGKLAEKVFATAEMLGVNIRFVNQTFMKEVAGDALGDMVEYKTSYFNDTAVSDQKKAQTILHELIHTCTVYVMYEDSKYNFMGEYGRVSGKSEDYVRLRNAGTRLNRIFNEIKNDSDFKGQYGTKNSMEMVAELSNEKFVALLQKKTLWERIIEAIAELFGFSRGNTAYDNAMQCLDYMLDNPDVAEYKAHAKEQRENARYNGMDVFGSTKYTDYYGNERVKFSDRVLMGSLFSGGGTLEAGLAYQMLDKQFGVEYDGKIASVYADNHGDHIQVGRVEDFDISKYDDIFYLHASPVCHNFSAAKHGAKELQMDIDSAKATAKHLETAMPQVFTVENAPGYRKSQSLKIITDKLTQLGYKWDVDVYNSADYGSATSRNRVILRAVKDGELPAKPTKQERTNSWDKVTRDLWDTLPKSALRPSFISAIENTPKLPILDANGKVNVNKPLLILTTTSGHQVTYCWEGEICPTLTTKCGEAKLVMPDGNIYAVTPEFMGRIQGLPDDYKYPKEKTRAFTIIGNGIPTHLTKAVVGGVLDSAYEQTHDGQVLYSDRNTSTSERATPLADYSIDDLLLEELLNDEDWGDWGVLGGKSSIEDLSEELGIDTERIEILFYREGLGNSYVEDGRKAVMTQSRIDEAIAYNGATNPTYARRLITRISPKDFIDLTVMKDNQNRAVFDSKVQGDHGNTMGNYDYEGALKNSRSNPYLVIDVPTGRVIGHNGRHRMRAMELLGINSVEIEVELYDEGIVKNHKGIIQDLAISSQFDTKTQTHLSNIIPLNESYRGEIETTYGEKAHPDANVKYSDRSPSSVSTRSLLANALETTAQNDIERNKLEQYKNKIDLIEAEYAKLSEIKKKANDIRFTKGRTSAETKQMKALEFEANQIANRINTYDRQLFNLESTTALKNVLQREKELARRKEAKKGKDALARQREKEAKTIRTLMDKNTESKKKAAERADKTTMRREIRKVVKELNSLLENSNKKKNIKEEEKTTVATALALAEVLFNDDIKNEDIVRLGVDSVTEQESILLNEYRDLLDIRDTLISKIEATYGNGIVKENLLTEVGSIEEELAKVKNRISTLNSKLSEVFERERARLNRATMNSIFDALITEYSNLANSGNDYIKNAYSEAMKTRLETLKNDLGGKIAKDMSIHQLAEVYDTFVAIKHMISKSNKIFREGRAEDLATYVSNTQGEIYESTTEPKDKGVVADAIASAFNEFSWNNLRPVDAFERLGSKTFEKLFWDYIHGMVVAAKDVAEAGEVIANAREKYGYSKWNISLADTAYTTRDGLTFKPSLADKLSIYAYSKREKADGTKQAMKHMVDGGFTYDTGRTYKDVKDGKTYVRKKLSSTYRLSEGNIKSIIDSLTQEQKAYVDAILPYLTDMGKKGNEVSMTLYGIELFGEKVYFPLQSSADYLSSTTQELGATPTMSSLANSGFTKQTKPKADNPIVLRGFDDVVLEHIEKMSNYHGLVIPIENLRRVFDNVSRDSEKNSLSTKALIGSRFGTEAQKYFAQLLTDLNGGMSPSGAKNFFGKLFSKGKAMSVSANLSVVAQQYFSIIRAMELVDPKYFTPFLNGEAKKTDMKQYEELLKYAPIAIIKEMNGFDVGSSGRVKDYIGYEGARKDAKYIRKKIDDTAMWGAGKMDELGWVTIWKAIKAEVASEQKLTPGTDEFYKACNIRFTEVVTKTQVYDSVASRSGYMRSKFDAVKYATSFMGEPTVVMGRYFVTGLNLAHAIKTKDGGKIKDAALHFGRAVAVIALSQALGNLAKSLIYAGRDDEEDEAFLEKWMKNFAKALASDLNPFNSLPFTRDIMSIIEGWDVERPDLTLIADVVTSTKKMFDGDITLDDSLNLIGSVGNFFGIPFKNVIREIKSAINVTDDIFDDVHPTDMGGAFIEGLTGEERTKKESLYTAIVRGDTGKIEAIKGTYKTDEAYKTAIKSALRENDSRIKKAAKERNSNNIRGYSNYVDTIVAEGHFDKETVEGAIRAEMNAFNTKINKAAEAKNKGNDAEYKQIVRELRDSYRGIYSQDEIVNLIKKAQNDIVTSGNDEDAEVAYSIYTNSDVNSAFESGDTNMALEVIEDLINTKVENYLAEARKEAEESGKTFNERKAQKEAESKAKSSIRSSMTSYWKPLYKKAYRSGNTSEKERIERILKASGLFGTASEVIKTCREWRTERD